MPTGEIVAHPARGLFMGNRGILHDTDGHLSHRRWAHKAWVTCLLSFKNRRATINAPGHYTQLFFHDEAVAFAAGHRPCAECRRSAYEAFRSAAGIIRQIKKFDDKLHDERAIPRLFLQRRHEGALGDLPDGAFILTADGRPALVLGDAVLPFGPDGYQAKEPRRAGNVTVLTPRPLLDALRGGYRLNLDLSGVS